MEAKVYRLDELPVDSPMDKIERRRIIGEQMMISVVSLEPGLTVPTHRHDNEQFAFVVSGRLRFGLGEEGGADYREVEVAAGEVMHLPGNVPHSAVALEGSRVIDMFAPPSEGTGIDRA
jgi:quercetin dioxygenase-like cupin family protein